MSRGPHYYQAPDPSPTVKEMHKTKSNPTHQRSEERSNIQQIPNPLTTLQLPSNYSLEQQQFQSKSKGFGFYKTDRQEDTSTPSHQVPDTLHSTVDLPIFPGVRTLKMIPTDSKETRSSRQDIHSADNLFERNFRSPNPVQYPSSKTDSTELRLRLIRSRFRSPKRTTMKHQVHLPKPYDVLLKIRVNRGSRRVRLKSLGCSPRRYHAPPNTRCFCFPTHGTHQSAASRPTLPTPPTDFFFEIIGMRSRYVSIFIPLRSGTCRSTIF